jgi:heptose-I-phosphate ethanolaminephosphotransferase
MTTYTTEEADNYISNFSENTPFNNLLFSIKMRQLADRGLEILRNTQDSIRVDSCSYTSNKIVLIIGESYIKCHSQLYSYQLPTTPRQLSRFKTSETGCLIPFTNVISPSNLTSTVFKNIFSLKSIDNKDDWAFYPLFPVLFRKAGFQVSFISNQFVKKQNSDIFNFSGGLFINDDKLNKAQFNHRNTNTHQFDIELLSDYDSLSVFQGEHQLTIFHLAGQHIDFKKRSPSEMKVFKPSNYDFRNNLNETAKQLVADYDNATYYNDYVVDSIIKKYEDKDAIVIYMPDHGEECFDELQRMGRLPHGNYSPEVLRQEYQIPFWIWCSSEYIDNHPIIFEQIQKACDRPFMTDDLPHLLLYLAGINCDYYIDSKCLISDQYNQKRKRMINNTANFDDIIRKQ